MRVSRPHGRSCTKVACAISSASATSASLASGYPSVRLSRTLEENSVASSKATDTRLRSEVSCRSRMSRPSIVMRPAVTSYSRGTSADRVVLPLPVTPDDRERLARA